MTEAQYLEKTTEFFFTNLKAFVAAALRAIEFIYGPACLAGPLIFFIKMFVLLQNI